MVGSFQYIVILNEILWDYEIVVHDEPEFVSGFGLEGSTHGVVSLGEIDFAFAEKLGAGYFGVEVGDVAVDWVFDHEDFAD